MTDLQHQGSPLNAVALWVEHTVIGLNLCPFAKREWVRNSVRLVLTESTSEDDLLSALQTEIETLCREPSIETSLLIHPRVLHAFEDYNQFLHQADELLAALNLDGVIQIASFHPQYQFSGTAPDDAENYTNRSPYPLLHLLREDSVARAVNQHPDVESIPTRNIDLMNQIGADELARRLGATLSGADSEAFTRDKHP